MASSASSIRWAAAASAGRFLVQAMPKVLAVLSTVGIVAMLWVGKLIIDQVVALSAAGGPDTLAGWWESGLAHPLIGLVALELALAIAQDVLGPMAGWLMLLVALASWVLRHGPEDQHADEVLSADPFALLVGMLLDQHVSRGTVEPSA